MSIYDGFDGYDGDFGDYEDDHDGGFDHNEDTSHDEPFDRGIEWQDWMIIGPLSEDLARERREKRKIEKDNDTDYLDIGP